MNNATPTLQPLRMQPFATWEPTRGIWLTAQLDLCGQWEPYLAIWPTCGCLRDGSAYPLPLSVLPTIGFASSSSPIVRFRTPLASDSQWGGESLEHVRARRGTIALSHQIIDLALNGPHGSASRNGESETLWPLIEQLFDDGDATPQPSHAGSTSPDDKHPRRRS
jgi:hypothetical protein